MPSMLAFSTFFKENLNVKPMLSLLVAGMFVFFPQAQKSDGKTIQWGEMERASNWTGKILPKKGGDFFTIKAGKNTFLGSQLFLSEINSLQEKSTKRLDLKVNKSFAQYEGVITLNDELYVFLSDRTKEYYSIFLQKYSQDLKPSGEPMKIGSYEIERSREKGEFKVVQSENGKFFGAVWNVPGKKEMKDGYGFKILDQEMNEVSSGNYSFPYDPELCGESRHYLSNEGHYFLVTKEYQEGEKKFLRTELDHKALHLFQFSSDGFKEYTVDIEKRRIDRLVMRTNGDGEFVMSAVYGSERCSNAIGIFTFNLNIHSEIEPTSNFTPFDEEFIVRGMSKRELDEAQTCKKNGDGSPELCNYMLRDYTLLPNGKVVGSLEQYYVVESNASDPRGVTMQTSYMYFYNTIICFSIDQNGEFDWLQKVPKVQMSRDDGGYYSSYAQFNKEGKMMLFFNDDRRNYNENEDYVALYEDFSKKKRYNVMAMITIDHETGEMERKVLFSRKDIDAIGVPRKFKYDDNSEQVILYANISNKEKFGLLNSNLIVQK